MQEFKDQCELIDQEIKRIDIVQNTSSLIDGVIDPDAYLVSKYKILWILKEPYDDFDENGNPQSEGWDYRKDLRENLYAYKAYATWRRIAYTSYAILNDCAYDDMDDLQKDENVNDTVFDTVKSIAFINVKKVPGGKSTLPTNLRSAYLLNKELLLKQIEVCNPDVVIGGGTMPLFLRDLNLEEHKEEGNNLKYYIKDSRVYIDAYHPSYPKGGLQEEEYVDVIARVFKTTIKGFNELSQNITTP